MHGRLKLRPPDSARRRQREEKLRQYRESMDTLLGGAPPAQVLSLTASVLAANPDVGTCWNLRRRALGELGGDWVPSELAFVGQCLGVNPKSYGAWHHRGWVLQRAPPAGREELALCERLLAADPRNFHAWEHRRALVGAGDAEAELSFAGALLSRDFSNFSAWHQRLRLLGAAAKDCGKGIQKELELVHSAVFTDPTDQSPWVYLRCLLSQGSRAPRAVFVHVERGSAAAAVAVVFSRPLKVNPDRPEVEVAVNGSALSVTWRSGEGRPRPSHTWLCDIPAPPSESPAHIEITCPPGSAPCAITLHPGEAEAWWEEPMVERELFWAELGVAPPPVLQAQLGPCRELLELEPRSRGCLLTLSLLLASLDPRGHAQEIREHLRTLQDADPLRAGFVADIRSRFEVVLGILGAGEGLSLCDKGLTVVPLLERAGAITRLELARNELRAIPGALGALRRLRELDLSDNHVTDLGSAPPLPRLELLRLDRNRRDWFILVYTGRDWDGLGGNWEGLGWNWDELGGTGMDWEGTGMDWEGTGRELGWTGRELGWTGMDWEGTGMNWDELGETGMDWEGTGQPCGSILVFTGLYWAAISLHEDWGAWSEQAPPPAISHASALTSLAAWPRLARLGLVETPLGSAPDGPAHVTELLPRVEVAFS